MTEAPVDSEPFYKGTFVKNMSQTMRSTATLSQTRDSVACSSYPIAGERIRVSKQVGGVVSPIEVVRAHRCAIKVVRGTKQLRDSVQVC